MAEFLLRLILWFILPVFLITLAIGPARVGTWLAGVWSWIWESKLEPAEVLDRVVKEHQRKIAQLKEVLQQGDTTQGEIQKNIRKSEEMVASLEGEARAAVRREEDNEARAALAKMALERQALQGFSVQLQQHKLRTTQARRRLHLLELQLRQFEVGRSILLNQLAEARTVEQQYQLANQFDPFSAIAEWQKAEGDVQEAAENARAVEQVLTDTADLPLSTQPVRLDPAELNAQLARLKEDVQSERMGTRNGTTAH
jgi:phage shock protein A